MSGDNVGTTTGDGRFWETLPTIAGLAIVLGFTLLGVVGGETSSAAITSATFWTGDAVKWIVALAVLAVVVFWERKSIGSIGLRRPSRRDLLWGVGLGLFAVFGSDVVTSVVGSLLHQPQSTAIESTLLSFPLIQRVEIVVAAAVVEEVLYRGYPIERLESITGSTTLAAAIPVVLFVGVHLPTWGPVAGAGQLFETLLLTGLYVWRRNLPACIAMHATIDGLGLVILPLL